MAKISEKGLEHLKGLAESVKEVRELREEKDKTLRDLNKNDPSKAYKPDLTPKDDLYFQKPTYSNTRDPRDIEKQEQQISERYNEQIKEAVRDNFEKNNYSEELKMLDQVDVVQLMEKGTAYVQARQELETELKTSLDHQAPSMDQPERTNSKELTDPFQDKMSEFNQNKTDIDHGRERD